MKRRTVHSGARCGRWVPAAAGLALVSFACGDDLSALRRGDEAWARGEREKALAEYQLALLQAADSALALVRLAHVYAETEQVDRARDYYRRAVAADSDHVDQAVADLVRLAQRSFRRGDQFAGAAAAEAALDIRPGLRIQGLERPLARYYSAGGSPGRAIRYLEDALAEASSDSVPPLVYELALAYEELGDCERALVFFERYRTITRPGRRESVEWHIGNCSLELARAARANDRNDEALAHLQTVILVAEPQNRLDEAYFEKGEILLERDERAAALEAYRRVLDLAAGRRGPFVTRAEQRIEEIRFGRRPRGVGDSESAGPQAAGSAIL